MRKLFSICLIAFLGVGNLQATAGDNPIVVELYTSQGCSSCPPADKMLARLANKRDVLALALHVDYWDYIGWKDEFADPKNTQRQRAYAREGNRRMIYTPQMIVGGVANIEGARPNQLNNALRQMKGAGTNVGLSLSQRGDTLTIRARKTNLSEETVVQLIRFNPKQTVDILRGENRGRTITYSNVVSSWETVATWDGSEDLLLREDVSGQDRVAVIIQNHGPGKIIAAAQLH